DALQLGRCMDTKATEAEVNKSVAESRDLRINSTPTLFVNGRRLPSQIAWPDLRQIIDQEIEYQKTAKNAGEDCGCEVSLPAPALAKAAAYIARQFKADGLQPFDGKSYLQPFPVTTNAQLGSGNRFEYVDGGRATALKFEEDFIPFNFSARAKASGPIVFAGYG